MTVFQFKAMGGDWEIVDTDTVSDEVARRLCRLQPSVALPTLPSAKDSAGPGGRAVYQQAQPQPRVRPPAGLPKCGNYPVDTPTQLGYPRREADQKTSRLQGGSMGIAGMILGIFAVIFAFIPIFGAFVAIPCVIVGLPLAIVGFVRNRRRGQGFGMSLTGMVTCIVAIIIVIVWAVAVGAAVSEGAEDLNEAFEELEEALSEENGRDFMMRQPCVDVMTEYDAVKAVGSDTALMHVSRRLQHQVRCANLRASVTHGPRLSHVAD